MAKESKKSLHSRVREFLIGEARPIKTLSTEERGQFYGDLGLKFVGIVVLLIIVAILANTTIAHGSLSSMIWWTVAVIGVMVVLKMITPLYKVEKIVTKIPKRCSYSVGDDVIYIYVDGKNYRCFNYDLDENGQLMDCFLLLKESDLEQIEVCLYFDEYQSCFIEQTTLKKTAGITLRYRILAWLFWIVSFTISIYWMVKLVDLTIGWLFWPTFFQKK